jgi:formate hydrogenlyase transcriptional activator
MRLLTEYHWPGNVRELENIIERAMIVANGDFLELDSQWLRSDDTKTRPDNREGSGLAGIERQAILNALQRSKGKIYGPHGAAALLGLKPTTLYGRMRKHQISKDDQE